MYNLLSELLEPGDYYIDRTDKKLYFIPPHEGGSLEISVLDQLFNTKELSYVAFENLTLENVRGSAFSINGDHCEMTGCVIRNTGKNGGSFSGSDNVLYGCDVYNTGAGGVSMTGGDRKTLTPGHNCAENNHVHHYSRRARTYTTAIRIDGCGNRMAHNLLHHGPHMALAAGGNDHVVEFNEIHNAVYESGDAGAYYVTTTSSSTAGRPPIWTTAAWAGRRRRRTIRTASSAAICGTCRTRANCGRSAIRRL